ncbi:hypothetical protein DFQ29_004297 [Apophysomyces sp. BC1021]|nr:hypothetical protein DFQ29_004297 [Apophysomyces sp. BC1021]
MTGHTNTLHQQQLTGSTVYANQYQTAAMVPFTPAAQPPLMSSAAGQQSFQGNAMTGYVGYSGLQRSSTISGGITSQSTGARNWQSATPQNPFGSPTLSPLNPQMTGVQYSTPNMSAFVNDPTVQSQPSYLQPQMTGIPPQQVSGTNPTTAHIFTLAGSLQYGQSGFPTNQHASYQYSSGRGW